MKSVLKIRFDGVLLETIIPGYSVLQMHSKHPKISD